MKKFLIYKSFLLIVFMMSLTVLSTYVCEKYITYLPVEIEQNSEAPLSGLCFSNFDAAPVSTALTRIQHRVNHLIVKTDTHSHLSRITCNSQLALQQFFHTQLSYNSFCSGKESQGYYIYALRKLLI